MPARSWKILVLSLLLLGLAAGCPAASPPRTAGEGPRSAPRVRVGKILRLPSAGVIEEQGLPSGEGVPVALVPAARGARSWQLALDTQGNQFRVAPGGRIVPDGEPNPDREPASEANVAFYYAQALALLAARHRREGLVMAAEVLDLPARDPVVRVAQRQLCAVFARLAIQGVVRKRLYQNLVAISHREGAKVEIRNHAHGFSIEMPLGWKLLAGPVPTLGPEATAMVIAGAGGPADGVRVNLLWSTTRVPPSGDLSTWAAARRLATVDSKVLPVPALAPPGLGGARAFRVEPLDYQGRRLASLQVFFEERGLLHHLALLAPDGAGLDGVRPTFVALVGSFRPGQRPWPCAEVAAPPGPRPP